MFQDTVIIGPDTLVCQGKYDMFVAKFDSAGTGLWARRAGGIGRAPGFPGHIFDEDGGTAIGADSAGNVYVTGYFYWRPGISITFDSIAINYSSGSFIIGPSGFLAKYNPQGKIQWVRTVEGLTATTSARAIGVTKTGDSYLTGALGSTTTFGAGGPILVHQGGTDIWYARYDTNGNLTWARSFGGASSDVVNDLAVNAAGEFFLTGWFHNNLPIGPFTLTWQAQKGTLFLARFNANGVPVWASQTSGSGSIGDAAMVIDPSDNVYVGAAFTDQVTVGTQVITASGVFHNPVIIKWNGSGTPEWAATGQGKGSVYGIAFDPTFTDCYLSGVFEGGVAFGNHYISGARAGFFLAKLGGIVNSVSETSPEMLSVYPNPARKFLNLDLLKTNGNITLELTDMHGKVVLTKTETATRNLRLELPQLASGVYLLTAQSAKQVFRRKIIIH